MNNYLARIVAWLKAGYPDGVPGRDQVPLLALLRRRLTDDEVRAVAHALTEQGPGFDLVDVGVGITRITDELPSAEDVDRVRSRLAATGWPLDDEPRGGPADGPGGKP